MPTPTKIKPDQILLKAMEILEQEGLENLSMRELARQLSVKAPSLYRYYPDKVSIERAAVDLGNQLMLAALQGAVASLAPGYPAEAAAQNAIRAASLAYCEFARTRPNLYSLMMEERLVFPPVSDSGKRLWNFVLSLVEQPSEDSTGKAVALWSFLHGFVSLERSGMFGASGPRDGFQIGIEALIVSFRPDEVEPAS